MPVQPLMKRRLLAALHKLRKPSQQNIQHWIDLLQAICQQNGYGVDYRNVDLAEFRAYVEFSIECIDSWQVVSDRIDPLRRFNLFVELLQADELRQVEREHFGYQYVVMPRARLVGYRYHFRATLTN